MPNPLQFWQHPGVMLTGAMALVSIIMWLLRERDRDVKYICASVSATGILLIAMFGATAPNNPVGTGISSWFALVALVAGISTLVLVYKVMTVQTDSDDLLDAALLGLTAMSYLTLACELFLVGRNDTGRWTGIIRKLPVVPLWVAAALVLVVIVLIGMNAWSNFTDYRRTLRKSDTGKRSDG